MTRADFYGGVILAVFFGAALWEGLTFQYGTEFAPGPGFAPVWLSTLGLCVSLAIAAHGLLLMRRTERSAETEPPALEPRGVARVVFTLIGLTAMIFVVPSLGLALAIAGFLLYLTLVVQRHSLLVAICASAGTVVFVYLVFVRFLDVPVPTGPLGF